MQNGNGGRLPPFAWGIFSTVTSAIARRAAESAHETALADENATFDWQQVDALASRAAWALNQLPEGRIAIIAENAAEVLIAHLGILLAGRSAVPVNHHLRVDEAAYLLKAGKVVAVLTGPESADLAVAAAHDAGILHVFGWRCETRNDLTHWQAALAATPSDRFDAVKPPQPPLMFTSGTTGIPKAIELPQAMFPRTATLDEHLAEIGRTDALAGIGAHLVAGPLYHTGPLGASRLLSLGTPVVILRKFDPGRMLQAIERHRIASMVCVPTHFVRLLALPGDERRRYDLSSLRFVGHTGAPCPIEVKRAMIQWWGPVLFESYGATEIGGVARISSEDWLKYPGSVGRARDRFTFHVVDESGAPVSPGKEGRIYFKDSLGIGIEFQGDPEKTAAAHLEPGVFTLGEVGYVNDEGYLFLTDRFSDMVISGGANIYPAEAEKILVDHPGIADVACIGLPHPDLGEVLHALVVRKDDALTAPMVLDYCRDHLSIAKCPRSVAFVAEVGRNAMGKINKQSLRKDYLARREGLPQ
jgi:long-chain acyl-CoA synthetase